MNVIVRLKLSKTQLHKIGQSGEFLSRPLETLLKTGLPLMKNVLKPLAKTVLISLGLTTVAPAIISAIQKKIFRSGMTTLIISNKEMNDIVKIVESFEEFGLLIKCVSETIQNEAKEQNRGFLEMLLGTLGTRYLENLLTGKGVMRACEGTVRAGQDF